MAAAERHEVEQVAMLAGGGIGPFAGRAAPSCGSHDAYEEAAARIVVYIADKPVVSAATALRKVFLADGLSILGKAGGQVCGIPLHGRASAARSVDASTGAAYAGAANARPVREGGICKPFR